MLRRCSVDPGFVMVGRELELAALREELLDTDAGIAVVSGDSGVGKTALVDWFGSTDGNQLPGGAWREDFSHVPEEASAADWKRAVYDALHRVVEEAGGKRALLVVDERPKRPSQVWRTDEQFSSTWDAHPAATLVLSSARRTTPAISCLMTVTPPRDSWEARFAQPRFPILERGRSGPWLDVSLRRVSRRELTETLRRETQGSMYDIRRLIKRTSGDLEVAAIVLDLARRGEPAELLVERFEPVVLPGTLNHNGAAIADPEPGMLAAEVAQLDEVRGRLSGRLKASPELMRTLRPREFEEFVGELYLEAGFDVDLTPMSNDGGFDLLARHRTPFGMMVTLIECKRYSPARPVQVHLVRQLYGVVEAAGAHAGVLATTSTFTRGSQAFAKKHGRVYLQDYFALQDMLRGGGLDLDRGKG